MHAPYARMGATLKRQNRRKVRLKANGPSNNCVILWSVWSTGIDGKWCKASIGLVHRQENTLKYTKTECKHCVWRTKHHFWSTPETNETPSPAGVQATAETYPAHSRMAFGHVLQPVHWSFGEALSSLWIINRSGFCGSIVNSSIANGSNANGSAALNQARLDTCKQATNMSKVITNKRYSYHFSSLSKTIYKVYILGGKLRQN